MMQKLCVTAALVFASAGALRVDEESSYILVEDPAEADVAQGDAVQAEDGDEVAEEASEEEVVAPDLEVLANNTAEAKESVEESVIAAKESQALAKKSMDHLVAAQRTAEKKAHSSKRIAKKAVVDEEAVGEAKQSSIDADARAVSALNKEEIARTEAEEAALRAKVVVRVEDSAANLCAEKQEAVEMAEEQNKAAAYHATVAAKKQEAECEVALKTKHAAKYYEDKEGEGVEQVATAKANLKCANAQAVEAANAAAGMEAKLAAAKKVAEEAHLAQEEAEKSWTQAANEDAVVSDKAVNLYMAMGKANMEAKESNHVAQEKAAAERAASASVVAMKASHAAAAAKGSAEAAQEKLLQASSGAAQPQGQAQQVEHVQESQ